MAVEITVRRGPWSVSWMGGRLADVHHDDCPHAVECIQIGEYDFSLPAHELEATRIGICETHVGEALDEWLAEQGDCYYDNVVRWP